MHTLVMTGATRGIGRVAAAEVLRADPEVHLTVLARQNGPAGFTEFSDRVTVVVADLASIESIRAAVGTITRHLEEGSLPPLHGYVGNAGLQFVDALHETIDGLETTFAVNVLANHLLLRGLEPHFAAPSRVLITVSDTHFGDFRHTGGLVPAPRWSDPPVLARPKAFDNPDTVAAGRTAYSTSKLAAVYLVHEWSRRLPDGVEIVSYNPSLVPGTGLTREASAFDRFVSRWVLPALAVTPVVDRVPTAGRKLADAILGRTPAPSGAYIDRTRVVPSSRESYDPKRETALWDYLDGFVSPKPRTTGG